VVLNLLNYPFLSSYVTLSDVSASVTSLKNLYYGKYSTEYTSKNLVPLYKPQQILYYETSERSANQLLDYPILQHLFTHVAPSGVSRKWNAIFTLRVAPVRSDESIFLLHYGPAAKPFNALTGKQASI